MNHIESFYKLFEEYENHRYNLICNKLNIFEKLIQEFNELYEKNSSIRIAKYNDLLNKYFYCLKITLENEKTTSPKFNPLNLLKIEKQEIKHSDILAWLFDPFGTHSQGDLFFGHFVKYFGFDIEYTKWNYKVRREYYGKESIIDILIYGKDFIFYIENKTKCSEGKDQTPREYRDLRRLAKNIRKEKIFPIFLTPTGVKPLDKNDWMTISYSDMVSALRPSFDKIQSEYIRYFLYSWLNILKYLGGSA